MASANIPFLTKNLRWAIGCQTDFTAPVATNATQVRMLPAEEGSEVAYDRGTSLIPRTPVMDGLPIAPCGVRGSQGVTISMTQELHDTDGDGGVVTNYFAQTMLASGFSATTNGSSLVEFRPSHLTTAPVASAAVIPASSGTVVSPTAATLFRYQTTDNTGFPFMNRFTGCTGQTSFDLTTGEIAKISTTWQGTIDSSGDWQTATGVSSLPTAYSGSGDTADVSCKPYTVRAITMTINDSAEDQAANIMNLSSVSIDFKAEFVENQDPTQTYAFGISPVRFNASPEISFTIGLDAVNMGDQDFIGFLQAFRDGDEGNLTITLDTGDRASNTITFLFPRIQYAGYTPSDQAGAMSAQLTAKAVRESGSEADMPVIYYNYGGS